MSKSKWIALPLFVLACCISGCADQGSNNVIEAPQQSEQEVFDADAAYEQQYQDAADSYETDSPDSQ